MVWKGIKGNGNGRCGWGWAGEVLFCYFLGFVGNRLDMRWQEKGRERVG